MSYDNHFSRFIKKQGKHLSAAINFEINYNHNFFDIADIFNKFF